MLPQSPPSPEERAAALRRREEVGTRARRIHRRRIWAPRAVVIALAAGAVAFPLAIGRDAGGVMIPPNTHPHVTSPVPTWQVGVGGEATTSTSTSVPSSSPYEGYQGGSGPSTSGPTTTSTPTTVPTSTPTTVPGTPFSRSGSTVAAPGGSDVWAFSPAPGEQLNWTGFVVSAVPQDDASAEQGTVTVELTGDGSSPAQILYRTSLAWLVNVGWVSQSITQALTVPAGHYVGIVVDCTGGAVTCAGAVQVTGTTSKDPSTSTTSTSTTVPAGVVADDLQVTAPAGTTTTKTLAIFPAVQFDVTSWQLTDLARASGGRRGTVELEMIDPGVSSRVILEWNLATLAAVPDLTGTIAPAAIFAPGESLALVATCPAGQPACQVKLHVSGMGEDATSPEG